MSMFYALMALCLCGSTLAQVITPGACPDVQVQRHFNVTKLTGRWFEQARFYTLYQSGTECGAFDYIVRPNISKVISTGTSAITGKEQIFDTDLLVSDPKQGGKMLIKIPMSPTEGHDNLLALGTDNKTWALFFSCKAVCSMNLQYAWLLTRERIPDESIMRKVYKIFYRNNLDPTRLLRIKQRGCRNHSSEENNS